MPATGPVSVADLGTASLSMPAVSDNTTLRLDFILEANGVVLARNSCEIALCSPRKTPGLPP
ncbi:MAG: hypothetical protein RLW68_19045 [Devosia marina]|uniref:hypothetical protein n=1 Tax=Devosia marina TaxID=2683198 RepID=UPI001057D9D1